MLFIAGRKKIIVNANQGSLSRMKGSIGRLEWGERREGIEMRSHARLNDAFEQFGDGVQILYWSIAREVIFR